MENAQVIPQEEDVLRLLDLYGTSEKERNRLIEMSRDAARKGWWEDHFASLEDLGTYIGLEAEASSAWSWQPVVVPGLLQTPEYSRAIAQGLKPTRVLPPGQIEDRTRARIARQEVLTRQDPLTLWAVVDESVLYRRFADETVMRAQLRHIADMAALSNVTVQVVRLDVPRSIGTGSFTLLKFPASSDAPGMIYPDVVYFENLSGSFYLEEEVDTYRYELCFEDLTKSALDPEESVRLISEAAMRAWSSP